MPGLTRCRSIVVEVRNEEGLRVNDDEPVGGDVVLALEVVDLLGTRVVQRRGHAHVAEVDLTGRGG